MTACCSASLWGGGAASVVGEHVLGHGGRTFLRSVILRSGIVTAGRGGPPYDERASGPDRHLAATDLADLDRRRIGGMPSWCGGRAPVRFGDVPADGHRGVDPAPASPRRPLPAPPRAPRAHLARRLGPATAVSSSSPRATPCSSPSSRRPTLAPRPSPARPFSRPNRGRRTPSSRCGWASTPASRTRAAATTSRWPSTKRPASSARPTAAKPSRQPPRSPPRRGTLPASASTVSASSACVTSTARSSCGA